MEQDQLTQVIELAMKVRERVQAHVRREGYGRPDDLCGACGVASYVLYRVLSRKGIKATIVAGTDPEVPWAAHCWVEVEGEYIVDPTATQFDGYDSKPVHVEKIGKKPKGVYAEFSRDVLRGSAAVRDFEQWGSADPMWYRSWIKRTVKQLSV